MNFIQFEDFDNCGQAKPCLGGRQEQIFPEMAPFRVCSIVLRLCGADFHCLGLGSVRPEDRFVILRPRVGVFERHFEALSV